MVRKDKISDRDMKDINDSFKADTEGAIIEKSASGRVVTVRKGIVNSKGHVIKDYRGRILCRNKSRIKDGIQTMVARRGQKYDDIPAHLRELVTWSDADFT